MKKIHPIQGILNLYHSHSLLVTSFVVLVAFAVYYLVAIVEKPRLLCKCGGFFEHFLLANLPALNENFWPTFWCFDGRAQTVLGRTIRSGSPSMIYDRELISLKDGGIIALDWKWPSIQRETNSCSLLVLILPGLVGDSQADYVKNLVNICWKENIPSVVFNQRGRGGVDFKTQKVYCAANCDDLREVLGHIKLKFPETPLIGCGISLGGLILGNYLSDAGFKSGFIAAVVISVPYNLFVANRNMELPVLNYALNLHLTRNLVEILKVIKRCFSAECDKELLDSAIRCRTMKQIDERYVVKIFNYTSLEDYYSKASLHNKMGNIRIPLLCINAADDPFQPIEGIPFRSYESSDFLALMLTKRGGHLGFLKGAFPIYEHLHDKIFSQYLKAVRSNVNFFRNFNMFSCLS